MMPFSREERQFVYTWLSNMLGHELSASQLAQYQQGLFDDFFAFLTEQGFQAQVEGIQQQLQQLKTVELAHLELAADYTQLFLLDGSSSALPYASAYLPEAKLACHFTFLEALLVRFQLQLNRDKPEPSDHLCVYLELLRQLAEADDMKTYQQLIQDTLLPWLLPFNDKVQRVKTRTTFYQQVVVLLILLLQADCQN
ncbi:molecular chaperone TorD [Pasteurella multocida]|uniref:molecular chaperone TorD n=1 Tax=Pasteurella multocida TaxID=747 RepID=UPI002A53035E|nr:molecular chaperone TorD [Pasteurella multocida]MDY0487519.1 molecular chaperone TorD [Pasteurella multocida]MDY0594098.1 molecular chaperone TorD [Pasteurella multocida]MDY0663634.1 molecular chaperone TorD [Pasteurella multocida]MDY0665732.1 molecular chaperone TorD [Pasteurella multocida]